MYKEGERSVASQQKKIKKAFRQVETDICVRYNEEIKIVNTSYGIPGIL